jgi:ATP synthase protein I
LSWLALVGGLVVAMKAHGVAAWFEMRRMSRSMRASPRI